jgi:hypothetical protein
VRAKTIAALLAATAILLALAVPTIAARAHRYSSPASTTVFLSGKATNGFSFDYLGATSFGGFLTATRNSRLGADQNVSYLIPSRHTPAVDKDGRLDLKVGRLGHFRARFVPTSTKTEPPESGCGGGPSVVEKGYFVGSFSFHGERGYTRISSHREPGTVTRYGKTTCTVPSESLKGPRHLPRPTKKQRETEADEFHLLAGDAEGSITFQAWRDDAPVKNASLPTSFQVSLSERENGMEVTRSTSIIDFDSEEGAFSTPSPTDPLDEAVLAPPAPFTGSATFHLESPKTAGWTGDLAVELPGRAPLPLVGKGIDAGLCAGRPHCTKTLPEQQQFELENSSGSFGSNGSFYFGWATASASVIG